MWGGPRGPGRGRRGMGGGLTGTDAWGRTEKPRAHTQGARAACAQDYARARLRLGSVRGAFAAGQQTLSQWEENVVLEGSALCRVEPGGSVPPARQKLECRGWLRSSNGIVRRPRSESLTHMADSGPAPGSSFRQSRRECWDRLVYTCDAGDDLTRGLPGPLRLIQKQTQ